MTDYHSPTVVQPNIPAVDITPLERLILDLIFDAETENDGIYYHSWCGPSDIVTLSVDDLRAALEASYDRDESGIARHVSGLLARHDAEASDDPPDDIDVDLTEGESGWDRMFQDIVRRSAMIGEIVVTAAFTCTKMRSDGFWRQRDAHHRQRHSLSLHDGCPGGVLERGREGLARSAAFFVPGDVIAGKTAGVPRQARPRAGLRVFRAG